MTSIYKSEISGTREGGVVRRGLTEKGMFEQSFKRRVTLLQAGEGEGNAR